MISCRGLCDLSEPEIRDKLKSQGVAYVYRVTMKKEEKVVPTTTLSLTFSRCDMPKEIKVGYLKVMVELFVTNPWKCFNCNKFGRTSKRCRNNREVPTVQERQTRVMDP